MYSTRISDYGKSKCLSISRNDGMEITSWDDLMRLKNEQFGENAVAVEIFPKQSDLVNFSNTRHLWLIPELQHLGKYPFGNAI